MKKIVSLVVLVISLMFLAGCGQQAQSQEQASQGTPETDQPEQEDSSEFTMNMLYNYGLINEYEYRITSSAGGQQTVTNINYKISSDTINGKAAWLQQSDTSVQGSTVTTKMWLDKSNFACLKISINMDIAGQTINQDSQCPTQGPNSASTTEAPAVNYVGTESVTVPAGTFSAKKYESSGASYWVGSSVPLPLKVTYSGEGSMVMELVSYS